MAKNSIRTYSSTAASNTDVGGVDIQGTAPASNMDDSVREIMSHLAETNAGTAPVDDTWSFCDPADPTKKFRFDGGNITAGQTRVYTLGDNDATLGNIPVSNDNAALGSATKSWADLFLASGGVINWANGNYTITHSSGILTFSGVIAAASTIELGHASDTTLSRGAAGFMAVEGKRVPSPASQAAGDTLYRGSTEWERLAKGTAGQYLAMNSGATAPEWADAGYTYVGSQTGSGSSHITFDSSTGFSFAAGFDYIFQFDNIDPASDAYLLYQQATGAGPTYQTTGYKSVSVREGTAVRDPVTTGGAITTNSSPGGASADEVIDGEMTLLNPGSNAVHSAIFSGGYSLDDSTWTNFSGRAKRTTAEVVTGVRFYMSTGNVSGTIKVFRRKCA